MKRKQHEDDDGTQTRDTVWAALRMILDECVLSVRPFFLGGKFDNELTAAHFLNLAPHLHHQITVFPHSFSDSSLFFIIRQNS